METTVKYFTEHNLQLTQPATILDIAFFSIKWDLSFLRVTFNFSRQNS
jgi:hypothetical protein